MKFANPYWSNKLKMNALQRWILVHSILYYEMSNSVVSDRMFDKNARQLVAMQLEFSDEAKETAYWHVFYDFDGNSGFDLFNRLDDEEKEYLTTIASHVARISRITKARR